MYATTKAGLDTEDEYEKKKLELLMAEFVPLTKLMVTMVMMVATTMMMVLMVVMMMMITTAQPNRLNPTGLVSKQSLNK